MTGSSTAVLRLVGPTLRLTLVETAPIALRGDRWAELAGGSRSRALVSPRVREVYIRSRVPSGS